MNDINEEKFNCQLLNLSNQNVLNFLQHITFNSDSTIALAIQGQFINSYFFKNNYLKPISSIILLRNYEYEVKQLEYLKASNSILTIAQNKIQIGNLNGLNGRKFLLKIGIKQYNDYICGFLFNQTQSNLFITQINQICFFEQSINGWKCSQQFRIGYTDEVTSICLNFQEDELQIYGYDGYHGSGKLYIYHKQTQQQEIKWILIQTIFGVYRIGKLFRGFEDHLYCFNNNSLNVYKKSNQSQDYIKYASSKFKSRSQCFWNFCVRNKFVLVVEENFSINFIKEITIDMSALKSQFSRFFSKKCFLSQNEKFLVICNNEKTVIIELIYV